MIINNNKLNVFKNKIYNILCHITITDFEIVLNCVGNYNISYLIKKKYVSVFNHMNDLCLK
jgi:hypothetical protein